MVKNNWKVGHSRKKLHVQGERDGKNSGLCSGRLKYQSWFGSGRRRNKAREMGQHMEGFIWELNKKKRRLKMLSAKNLQMSNI